MLCELAPLIARIDLVTHAADRCRAINQLLGTHLTPSQIAAEFADDDLDILLIWKAQG